jgi:hypothetical protein
MITELERKLLIQAAKKPDEERLEAIDEVISVLKLQNPKSFYRDDEDKRLFTRVFYDQPDNLKLHLYNGYIVENKGSSERSKLFAMRDLVLLKK